MCFTTNLAHTLRNTGFRSVSDESGFETPRIKNIENHRTRATFLEARFTAGLQSSFERHVAQDDFKEKLSLLTFLKKRFRKSRSSLFQFPASHYLSFQKCASVCSETPLQRSWSLSTQFLDTHRVSMQHEKPIPEKNAQSVASLRRSWRYRRGSLNRAEFYKTLLERKLGPNRCADGSGSEVAA